MPVLACYVTDRGFAALERCAADLGRPLVELAEAAIENAALAADPGSCEGTLAPRQVVPPIRDRQDPSSTPQVEDEGRDSSAQSLPSGDEGPTASLPLTPLSDGDAGEAYEPTGKDTGSNG